MGREGREPTRRPRDAAATRAAILGAARAAFTRDGYDRVGVREIAAAAGIDPALVIRYFGSKDRLFAEAVTDRFALPDLLDADRSHVGERLARYAFQKEKAEGPEAIDTLLALLRSAGSEPAGASIRAAIDDQFVLPLARWLGGAHAEQRAGLIGAHLLGLLVARHVVRSLPLVADDVEPLVALIAPVLQRYVDGEPLIDGDAAHPLPDVPQTSPRTDGEPRTATGVGAAAPGR